MNDSPPLTDEEREHYRLPATDAQSRWEREAEQHDMEDNTEDDTDGDEKRK